MTPDALQFVRPQWLWVLLALPLLWAWWRRRREASEVWREAVDAHLLPHLLDAHRGHRRAAGAVALFAATLAIVAMAGPSLREVPSPLFESRTPLVVALDLSSAVLAPDLPPTRLAQARAKLAALLRERRGGQIALVAFADDAYTVTPLTEDTANVTLFLDALAPDVMPVDGHRPDRAIAHAARLLERAGAGRGEILLMTGRADALAARAAAEAAQRGHRVSVIGVGTAQGATYAGRDGGFHSTRLDADALRALADAGGGRYVQATIDAADLRALGVLEPGRGDASAGAPGGRVREDQGYWLLPPLVLLALLAFRRRAGAAAALACMIALPLLPAPARADGGLWRRDDQAEHARLVDGNRAYRAGDYARAARAYAGADSADAHYNRGNALARAGQLRQAVDAYDRALALRPGMDDAAANRRAVVAALSRRPPQGPRSSQPSPPQGSGTRDRPGDPSHGTPQPSDADPRGARDARGKTPPPAPPPRPQDAQSQRDAEAAQRAAIDRALREGRHGADAAPTMPRRRETPAERERRIANEAWLKRVPDDPGSLLAQKFRLEYERRRVRGEDD